MSSPNGKSEPVSRHNNSLLGNLNGSELTFVSCQVQCKGGVGRVPSRGALQSLPLSNPTRIVGPYFFCVTNKMYLSASSAQAHASAVICYGSGTVDLIQECTHTLWPWEDRWSREEWTVLPQSWPCHGLTPFLCFCLSLLPVMTFLPVLFFVHDVSLRIAVFSWFHAVPLFYRSSVCAMAVRNCLECQQAQFKQGREGTAHTYTALPANALGISKSASAQASHPPSPYPAFNINTITCVCFNWMELEAWIPSHSAA